MNLDNGEFKKGNLIHIWTWQVSICKKNSKSLIRLAKLNNKKWQSVLTAGTNMFDEVNPEKRYYYLMRRYLSLDWLKV